MFFNQKTPQAFGLDISEHSFKIAKLKKAENGLALACFGSGEVPSGVIEEGRVAEPKRLAKLIKKTMKEVKGEKLKSKAVVASLPEEKSFLDILRLPILKGEELASAVRFEAENHIPLGLSDVYFDFEVLPESQQGLKAQEVLIAASPREIVDSYLTALELANLRVLSLEIESLAIARALIKKGVQQKPLLIIDFGESRTSFVIYSGWSLRFTSTIPISSRALTEQIALKLKKDFAAADQLKQKEGLAGSKQLASAMLTVLNDLVSQIQNHLKYYRSHAFGSGNVKVNSQLTKILLCGGGANLKGLDQFLSDKLNLKVELGNPWVNIFSGKIRQAPALPFEESLGYATSLGLALRAFYGN